MVGVNRKDCPFQIFLNALVASQENIEGFLPVTAAKGGRGIRQETIGLYRYKFFFKLQGDIYV